MERSELTNWRPQKSEDFVGEENKRRIRDVIAELRQGRWAGPLAVCGPYGGGKTSLCRLLARCVCCPKFQGAGEPCGACEGCLSQSPAYNSDRHQFRHWEMDCAGMSRRRLATFCSQVVAENRAIVFFDEVPSLEHPTAQKLLLKFADEFRGILLLAVTLDTDAERVEDKLLAPLCDRLRPLRLRRPPEAEAVQFFADLARTKNIRANESDLRLMVRAAERSFRKCLQVLARAERDRALTQPMIGEVLELGRGWEDDLD